MSKQQYEAGFDASKKGKAKEPAEAKVRKANTLIRPRLSAARQPKRDKFAGLSRRAKRRKMAMEEDAEETGAIRAAVRSAKKASRPVKIGEPERRPNSTKKDRKKKAARTKSVTKPKGGAFEKDMGQRAPREGVRAKKGDVIGGMGKKKGGKRKA